MIDHASITRKLASEGVTLPVVVDHHSGREERLRRVAEERQRKRDEAAADRFTKMRELQRMGWTFTEISRFMGISRNTVVRELFTKAYRGTGE